MAKDRDLQPLQPVPALDLTRYAGRWYEIARLPNKFQKNCAGEVAATYAPLTGGRLSVVNECRRADGTTTRVEGRARLASKRGPASKLKVRFAPSWLSWLPFVWADYWVIELAPDYTHAVVATPDRKYLWVLSRTPQLDEATYGELLRRAAAAGFDVGRVMKTRQSP